MKRTYSIFIIFTLFLGLYSCGNDEITTKQIAQLTSIDRQIDSMQTILNEFDFDAIFHYSKEMADDKKAIKTNYHSDSVDVQLGRKVNRFNGIRKQFGKAASQGKMFHTKLEVQKTQTNKLLNDIKLGAGHKEKYQDYINLEIKNMQVLTEEFAELNKTTTRNLKEYKEINPFIKSFIEEIRKVD